MTNLPLQPATTFVDTSRRALVAQIQRIHLRCVAPGQPAELALKTPPGRVLSGKVEAIVRVTAEGQALIGGSAPPPQAVAAEPFHVRIGLDEGRDDAAILPGTAGTAAIHTGEMSLACIIRKVMIRMESDLNYIVAPL